MSTWDNMLSILKYGGLAIAIIIVAIIIYILVMVFIGLLRKPSKESRRKDDYMAVAQDAANDWFWEERVLNPARQKELTEAFRDGARWGWDNFYRD